MTYMTKLTCFKAYDIRGKLGTELNEEIAYKLAVLMDRFISLKRWSSAVISGSVVKA